MKKTIKFIVLIAVVNILFNIIFIGIQHVGKNNYNILNEEQTQEYAKNSLAIMIQQEDGSYKQSLESTFPKGYFLDKVKCTDGSKELTDTELPELSYDSENGILKGYIGNTMYCYIYFTNISKELNLETLCESFKNYRDMQECIQDKKSGVGDIRNITDNLQGDLYRYEGTSDVVNNNYICFGTTDTSQCLNNKEQHMYRIVGIDENGRLKLVKENSMPDAVIGKAYSTLTGSCVSADWSASPIRTAINGSEFYTNNYFVPDAWRNKISKSKWYYGYMSPSNSEGRLYTVNQIYEIETGKIAERTSICGTGGGYWNWVDDYVGMLYYSDVIYSMTSKNVLGQADSWLPIDQPIVWLINGGIISSIGGPNGERIGMAYVRSKVTHGNLGESFVNAKDWVQPVFYLVSSIKVKGFGTINNPYMII